MVIQELTIANYSQIINIWNVCGMSPKIKGRDSYSNLKKQIITKKIVILGEVDSNGNLQGVVLISNDGRKGWINRLAVLPNYQRRGIATKLLKAAESYFLDQGIEVYGALVFSDNIASKKCLEKACFDVWSGIQYYSKRKSEES